MVLDRKNPSNSDSLRAIVSTPTRIEILRNVFEIEVKHIARMDSIHFINETSSGWIHCCSADRCV